TTPPTPLSLHDALPISGPDRGQQAGPPPLHEVAQLQTWGVAFCVRPHASAAANRLEMAGCEWKNHSTHFEGVRSARFCSASLFRSEEHTSELQSLAYLV